MERKETFIAIIVMLVIAFGITLTGWIKSRNELISLRSGTADLVQNYQSISACENLKTVENEKACTEKLVELSKLLTKYTEIIKKIQPVNAQ